MAENTEPEKKPFTADWFMRGALSRIGDSLDRLTGRGWTPSSSLATSGLVTRLKALLDAEAREVDGKGTVVPHNIKLKIQWDKFATNEDDSLERLRVELLTAAADHINDSLYYTYAPLELEVVEDYFTEGVKLYASFGDFEETVNERELNVTLPVMDRAVLNIPIDPTTEAEGKRIELVAKFAVDGKARDKKLSVEPGMRLSVGRSGGNDIFIDEKSVSKMHAAIRVETDGGLSIADTGSTNGTFINDVRIAYGKAVRFEMGEKVRFGEVEIVFEPVPRTEDPTVAFETPLILSTADADTHRSIQPEDEADRESTPDR